MAVVVDDATMVLAGQLFYGYYHGQFDYVLVQRLTTAGIGARFDPRAWPVGVARALPWPALLHCTNILPWGTGTKLIRDCIVSFDSRPATVNDITNNWLFQKHTVVCYYFHVMDHVADDRIANHDVLGRKNKVNHHFKYTKNSIAALLIAKCCQGWGMNPSGLMTLADMENSPTYRLRYYMFVLPMISFLVTEMNPHAHLDARTILEINMERAEEYLLKRLRNHGIWSQDLMLQWIGSGLVSTVQHKNVTKGVEFQLARLCSLIVRDYKWPYSQEHRAPHKLFCRQQEIALMYQALPYDARAVPRYGVPTYHAT